MTNRIEKVRNILTNDTAALIKSRSNRLYLTGFESSDGVVLITKNTATFLIDFRYFEKAKNTVHHLNTVLADSLFEQISEMLSKENIGNLLVETEYISVGEAKRLSNNLKVSVSNSDILEKTLTESRAVKSEEELGFIIKAQELTDKTFSYILDRIQKGRTEREIMLDMEFYMRKLGSEGISFDFIVVSGKNSSLPHGVPTDKKIESGDFVTMDFGAVINGYRSDMTRTVAVGPVSNEAKAVYNTVLEAQKAAISAARAGEKCSDIDGIARNIIYNAGYKGCFGHALGHSVGIDIHESPAFSPKCDEILKVGNVMTVEPGIYIQNTFGVRIEDMIFITENGNIDLTKSPKELIVL